MVAALLHEADDHKLFKTDGEANARAIIQKVPPNWGRIRQLAQFEVAIRMFPPERGCKNLPGSVDMRWPSAYISIRELGISAAPYLQRS